MENFYYYKDIGIDLKTKGKNFTKKILPNNIKCQKNNFRYYFSDNDNNKMWTSVTPRYYLNYSKIINERLKDRDDIFQKDDILSRDRHIMDIYFSHSRSAKIVALPQFLIPQKSAIEFFNITKLDMITELWGYNVYNIRDLSNDRLFAVAHRSQLFELALFLFDEKFGNSFINKYNVLKELDNGIYPEKDIQQFGLFELVLENGLVPILEKISDDDWIFYKDNFDKYEEEIKEKSGGIS